MPSINRSSRPRALTGVVAGTTVAAAVLTGCATTALTGAPFASGCGVGTDSAAVRTTIHCFATAVSRQDAARACALLTHDAQQQAAEAAVGSDPRTCVGGTARAFRLVNDSPHATRFYRLLATIEVDRVSVHGSSASATVSLPDTDDSQPVMLRIEGGGWRLENDEVTA